MSYGQSDPDVVRRAGQFQRDEGKGPVVFTSTVYSIGKTSQGHLEPTLIKTMADFEQHFGTPGSPTIQEALDNR